MNGFDTLMRNYYLLLNNAWTQQVQEAAYKAISMLSEMSHSDRKNEQLVREMADMTAHILGDDFAAEMSRDTKTFMERAVTAGLQDVKATASIGLYGFADERLIQTVQKQQLFWIGNHFNTDIREGFTKALTEAMQKGSTTQELAAVLQSQFQNVVKRGSAYWQGLAEHTALRVREFARLQGYKKAQARYYRLVVVLDHRTSDICRALAKQNKVYPLNTALDVMDNLMALDTKKGLADNREYIKALAPWVKDDQIVYNKDGEPSGVQGSHTPFPPFHWKCRTTTAIVT